MKIKVVSPTAERAEYMAQIVRARDPEWEVVAAAGHVDTLPKVLNGSGAALLMLDQVQLDALDAIGRLSHTHPDVETIVISNEQTPQFLLKAMQSGVREVLPSPVHPPALLAAVERVARKRRVTHAAPVALGEVYAFMACKGGSGASVLAANLAHHLSTRDGRTVALIDLDLQFGNALLMLSDVQPGSDVAEVARNIGRLDAELLRSAMVELSPTLSVLAAPGDLAHALEVKAGHVESIIRQARQMFDFVVLDLGRSIDAVSMQALDLATTILPVMQLSLPQMRDAKRLRALFQSLDYAADRVHWVVNRHRKGGEFGLETLTQTLGLQRVAAIPNHYSGVTASINQGVPLARLQPGNVVTKALAELAAELSPPLSQKREHWLTTLFGSR